MKTSLSILELTDFIKVGKTNTIRRVADRKQALFSVSILEEIHSYAVKNGLSEDVQKTWHQLYLWACSPKRNLSQDLTRELNLSTPEEAMALFRKITPFTKGDTKVEQAIEFLYDLPAWAKPIPCEACRIREAAE